jgi:hypothetical protein
LSANVQWIVYSNGSACLVRILLNEREVLLPLRGVGAAEVGGSRAGGPGKGGSGVGGPFYRWEDLRRYCVQRLRAVGADVHDDMLGYLRKLN